MTALVSRGDTGPVVAEIQLRLVRAGLLPDTYLTQDLTSAVFDDATDEAVRLFQQDRGVPVDGVVGAETFRRLEEARWRLGDRMLVYSPGHLLAGDDVRDLQSQLSHMGFDCGRVDGVFGPATDAAVREFQRGVGARPDGMCGPDTFAAFLRLMRRIGDGNAETLREHHQLAQTRSGVAGKVVVLDPAHEGLTEEGIHIVDDIVARIDGRLSILGTQVLLTRSVHTRPAALADPSARARFANDLDADLYVSVHIDSYSSQHASGVSAFYFGDSITGRHSMAGRVAAERSQASICAHTDLVDLRCNAGTWDMLRITRMPAVALEVGYLTNPGDASKLSQPIFRDTLAKAIAEAIVVFYTPAG